jgi:predicted Fe-Mo cluster-binding NifX family protein
MIIAISSDGNSLESNVDTRFGRAPGFIVFNTETRESTFVENSQNLQAAQGAGIQSAKHILNADADALLTGHVGPKAFQVLKQGDVKIYSGVSGTVKDAIEDLKNDKLHLTDDADVDGHW